MNTRLLGMLCIIGGLAYSIGGVRFQLSPPPPASVPFQPDALTSILNILWTVGSFCGVLGILQLKVTGRHIIARLLTGIPLVTTTLLTLLGLMMLMGNTPPAPLPAIGLLGGLAGMTIIGVLALIARQWAGWRKFAPFAYLVALGIAVLSGLVINIFVGLAWVIIGYAVQSSEPMPSAQAAPAMG